MPNLKPLSLLVFFFVPACERIFIKTHSIKSRYMLQDRKIQFSDACVHLSAQKFTCQGTERVKYQHKEKEPCFEFSNCLPMANAGREVQYNISAALLSQMASFGENNTNFSWGKCLHRIPKYKQRTDMFMMQSVMLQLHICCSLFFLFRCCLGVVVFCCCFLCGFVVVCCCQRKDKGLRQKVSGN